MILAKSGLLPKSVGKTLDEGIRNFVAALTVDSV